jgi:hypothetical protein
MESSTRIAADILIAAVAATQNRITTLDEKQAKELAEAFKIIHKAVEEARDPTRK